MIQSNLGEETTCICELFSHRSSIQLLARKPLRRYPLQSLLSRQGSSFLLEKHNNGTIVPGSTRYRVPIGPLPPPDPTTSTLYGLDRIHPLIGRSSCRFIHTGMVPSIQTTTGFCRNTSVLKKKPYGQQQQHVIALLFTVVAVAVVNYCRLSGCTSFDRLRVVVLLTGKIRTALLLFVADAVRWLVVNSSCSVVVAVVSL
ncbi:expressed unknown protein [Seminavis robusta]|uniref:Uncharacterized protein n=1 Tax=Seminavis robusta TaxID=568900 RepID=A0A9N8HW19_9STRA|nr:expressed unknown protein [Seminavis robusta]|eukprot:Sro2498_g329372.1  (200) ;mRNA; r:11112-11711